MTPDHDAADAFMAETLIGAGWGRTTAGVAFRTAHMHYQNSNVNVTTQNDWEDESLLIQVSDAECSSSVRGIVSYQGDLSGFLRVLVAWQDRITQDNFEDLLRECARAGHEAYRVDGDIAIPVRP